MEPYRISDFGAGVMFIPSDWVILSGSARFHLCTFSFFSCNNTAIRSDGDGIPSYLEDLNGDTYENISHWCFES
jgi:hypothetical protein